MRGAGTPLHAGLRDTPLPLERRGMETNGVVGELETLGQVIHGPHALPEEGGGRPRVASGDEAEPWRFVGVILPSN